ncbi:MAG TPA: flagellar cap protein [Chromatiales bacterium]|nr:flagellar cap protein [Chromatiales bacterium]
MPTVSAPGLGSGLDIGAIVDSLVGVEAIPLNRLKADEFNLQADLSAYGKLKSALSSFQSALSDLSSLDKFKVFTSTSSNESSFTGTADSDAAGGSYSINVTAVAAVNKLQSGAFTASTDVLDTGTLTIASGSDSFDVVIDGTNNTLAGIRSAINEASDNTGVTATIITADAGSYLVLTSDESGTANAISVTVAGDGDGNDADNAGLSQLVYVSGGTENLTELQAAADSVVAIDGFTITSSSNTVTSAVEGLSLKIEAIGSGTLNLRRDDTEIEASVQEFVDAYNELNNTIDAQRDGQLEAEGTLLTIENLIQNTFNTAANISGGAFSYLSEIGIRTNEEGDLTLDTSDLQTALNADFNGVAQVFANSTEGYVARLDSLVTSILQTDGVLDAREDGINTELETLADQKLVLERRLESIEARLLAQFTALDTLLSSLNNTSAFLSTQLANLPTIGSKK